MCLGEDLGEDKVLAKTWGSDLRTDFLKVKLSTTFDAA